MPASYNGVPVPALGAKISYTQNRLQVPDNPIVPFIEGDGTGRDIWKASQRVFDAAVQKAYGKRRRIVWYEVFAGEKAFKKFNNWLPQDTVEAIRELRVAIKGPLTTPIGGGIRSLNVALRQLLDLYACVRPVKYYRGVPSPVKHPERMNIVIFRENTEDVYAGIEWKQGTPETARLIDFLNNQKFTEGAFREWGYETATQEFRSDVVTERESWILDNKEKNPQLSIEDNALQIEPGLEFAAPEFRNSIYAEVREVLDSIRKTHGNEYSVLATPNLNGDYISDACAAQVGGLGIAPGANIGDQHAIFEATHGTAPKYADKDVINPGSLVLSGVMMFDFLGWSEAARLIEEALERTIQQKRVTYDFERLMEGATKVRTSEFANYIIENMGAKLSTAAD